MTIITMEQLEHIDKIAQSSGVFIGFLGGLVKAITSAHGIFDAIGKMVVGSIVAWLSAPFVRAHFAEEIYPMFVFLFGYGGTELVTYLQKLFQNIIANKAEALVNKLFAAKTELPAIGIHGTHVDAPSAVSVGKTGVNAQKAPTISENTANTGTATETGDKYHTDAMGFSRKETE